MNDKLTQSQQRLHDSLFELYIDGGLELFHVGTRGLRRDLIIRLETSALNPEKGEIIHFYAVNRWDGNDLFDEWAKPSVALPAEAEALIGVTNAQLDGCRSTDAVLDDFVSFISV
jgi:hypothetical protein